MIRPEARAAIWRWREALAGVALTVIGLYWAIGPQGLLGWIAWAVVPAGAVLVWTGIQRGLFRGPGDGQGVVQIVEGQISYFGPLTGGHVALTELTELRLDHAARPAHWILVQPGLPALAIPANARGAETLFDAFTTLPGLTGGRLLSALDAGGSGQQLVWARTPTATRITRLH